jgi:hypothetical protein
MRIQNTQANRRSLRLLHGDETWILDPGGAPRTVGLAGPAPLAQARDEHARLRDIAALLTLRGLDGPGVTFECEGEKRPSGIFRRLGGGTWLKVVRKAAGNPDISFWFAHDRGADGVVHASYPGVIRVAGDAVGYVPTEDYILQNWEQPQSDPAARRMRLPRTLRALGSNPGQPPFEFLRASVVSARIDAPLPAEAFSPFVAWLDPPR